MNKIDQVFDGIHNHVCDKNAAALDPKDNKKTFHLDTMSWRSTKSIEDIRKNILLKAWTLGVIGANMNGSIDSLIQTFICFIIALYPEIRDKIPNERNMRELYTGVILLPILLEAIVIIADHDTNNKINQVLMVMMNIYLVHWANSSDQPKKRKRWLQDESLKQRLLDLMNPPPITIKTSDV